MMLEEYIYQGSKKLRCGYTTGSCATAAAKAATEMLITGDRVLSVCIMTPKGIEIRPDIEDISEGDGYVCCAVRKDSGDDPDITNGMLVYATAKKCEDGVIIDGGKGVGRVTRNGLDQPVGNAAINSVPRKMITMAVKDVMEMYDYHGGIEIIISVPDGEKIAAKTFNPRLGIEGGISIIGTSGIVEPMSNQALIDTIRVEERMIRQEGKENLLVTIGNYSKTFLHDEMPHIIAKGVMCSNFIGEAIDTAIEYGFERVLIVGHIGKMVKLGAGIMNTHSAQADGRMDVIVTCGVIAGVDVNIFQKIPECVTVDDAISILKENGVYEKVQAVLKERINFYLENKVKGEIDIGAIYFSNKYGVIGRTKKADEIEKKLMEEWNG